MISFLDLKKINALHEKAFLKKTKSLLKSGWYVLGNEVKRFENKFSTYCNTAYCIGVGNGLDALLLIFKAHLELGNLQKGDEVIVPANTYIASVLAILQADLIPVFVEPNLDTFNIDTNLIQQKITQKTKAILVVHLYGQLCNMTEIYKIAAINSLIIVEDAAQSQGAKLQSSLPENNTFLSWTAAAHSFYPSKNLGALGDAGAVTTSNDQLAKTIQLLRNYGSEKKYFNKIIGFNSRLDEIQAAFLNVKLPFLDIENQARRRVATQYINEIQNPKIKLPFWDKTENHVFHLFVILTKNRDHFMEFLLQNNIQTMIHYPIAPHKQLALSQFSNLSLPITEQIHEQCVSLPMSQVLTDNEITKIIEAINQY